MNTYREQLTRPASPDIPTLGEVLAHRHAVRMWNQAAVEALTERRAFSVWHE